MCIRDRLQFSNDETTVAKSSGKTFINSELCLTKLGMTSIKAMVTILINKIATKETDKILVSLGRTFSLMGTSFSISSKKGFNKLISIKPITNGTKAPLIIYIQNIITAIISTETATYDKVK